MTTKAFFCASFLITVLGTVLEYVLRSLLSLHLPVFLPFYAQVTPRRLKQQAAHITIPAIHTMSTCPW